MRNTDDVLASGCRLHYYRRVPDLVIGGGRRAANPRPWRAAGIALAMLGVALMVAWFVYRRSVTYDMPPGEVHGPMEAMGQPPVLAFRQAGVAQPSTLSWTGGIPVVHLYGDAHAIGAAHGRLLAPLLAPVLRATVPSIERTVDEDGWTHRIRLGWRWRFVDDGYSEQDRRMIAGLVRGAAASHVEVAYTDLVRAQAGARH